MDVSNSSYNNERVICAINNIIYVSYKLTEIFPIINLQLHGFQAISVISEGAHRCRGYLNSAYFRGF